MMYFHRAASVKLAFIVMALLAATVANAYLLDCTHSSGVECVSTEALVDTSHEPVQEGLPATPINMTLMSFHVDQTRRARAIPESAPLLFLFSTLLAVVLVRAKSRNSK